MMNHEPEILDVAACGRGFCLRLLGVLAVVELLCLARCAAQPCYTWNVTSPVNVTVHVYNTHYAPVGSGGWVSAGGTGPGLPPFAGHDCDPNGIYVLQFTYNGTNSQTSAYAMQGNSGPSATNSFYFDPTTGQPQAPQVATVTIHNDGSYTAGYQILANGTPTGDYITVPAGATVTADVADPGGNSLMSYGRILSGSVNGGTVTDLAGGGTLINGGSGSNIVTNPYVDRGNFLTNASGFTDGTNNVDNLSAPVPTNSGEIAFGTNIIGTNALNNSTAQAGFNGVAGAVVQGNQGIINGLQTADQDIVGAIHQLDRDVTNDADQNRGFITNGLGQIETALGQLNASLSNWNGITNWVPTNDWNEQVQQATESAGAAWAGISNTWGSIVVRTNASSASAMDMTLSWAGIVMDCNPLHNAGIASLADWCRNAFVFLIALFSLRDAWTCVQEYLANHGAIRQTTAADDVPIANTASALVMAALITTAVAALPAFVATWGGQSGFIAAMAGGLFQNTNSAIGGGVALLDAFFPIDYAVAAAVAVLLFRVSVGSVYFVIVTTVRFLVG